MVLEPIALSVIAPLLFILLLPRKGRTIKLLLGILAAASAIAATVFFILIQRTTGNPDAGKKMPQMYVPCGIYLVIALWGILVSAEIHRKQKKEKEAKRALNEEKKREAESNKQA